MATETMSSLAITHPDLASEWHPTLNDTNPKNIKSNTSKKVWWLGPCGHEWEALISNRANLGSGCPFCSGKKVLIGYNDLASTYPNLANEWHPALNTELTPFDVTAGSNKESWWLGACGHQWKAKILSRTYSKSGCPVCSGRQVLAGYNDLASKNPEIACQWHPVLNERLTPMQITSGSAKKVWWICDKNHEWEASPSSRINGGRGCPVCSNKVILKGFNDLSSLFPEIAAEWHPVKNGEITPDSIASTSSRKYWWICKENHEWETTAAHRTSSKQNCPYCSHQKVLPGYNDLATANPELANQWHPEFNVELTPQMVNEWSSKKVWWMGKCGHAWLSSIASRNRTTTQYCPDCININIKIGINDLLTTHPELSKEWHLTKNSIQPSNVTAGSNQKVWWVCNKGHEWESSVNNRTKGSGCPVCGGKITLPGFNDLLSVNPILSSEWHPTKNGTLLPSMVTVGSNQKIWWVCGKDHEWEANISDRATRYMTGCAICSAKKFISKAEQEIADFVKCYGLAIEQTERKVLPGSEIDIYIPEKNIGIEFNGVYWHTEKMGKDKNYHKNKWELAKNKGIQLIQIWEDEWKANPGMVKSMLLHKLGITDPKNKVFARKTTIHQIPVDEVKAFFGENHIQGFASASYYLGLKDQANTLVALLALKQEGVNDLNIIRYATSKPVVGGFTRLMSHAEKQYSPDKFITFSDNCVSDGGLYLNNGFVADKELEPDYRYVVNGERKHKFGYRLKRFRDDPDLLWQEGLTERELADLNGLDRIWDAGKTRWVKAVQSKQ